MSHTGAIQRTSQENIYQELGLKYLSNRRWYKKLKFFKEIGNKLLPGILNSYLYNNNTNPASIT